MPNIFSFRGRVGRLSFLAGVSATLFLVLTTGVVLFLVAGRNRRVDTLIVLALLAFSLWPSLALLTRRLRDIGLSVWLAPALLPLKVLDHLLARSTGWRFLWPDQVVTPLWGLGWLAFCGAVLLWPGKREPAPPFTPVTAPDGRLRWVTAAVAAALVLGLIAPFVVDPYRPASCGGADADCARFGFGGRLYAATLLVSANAALDNGAPERALPSIDRALWLRPKFVYAWNSRGLAHAALGQHEAALADYGRAVALRPAYLKAYANRARSLLELGREDRARQDIETIYTASPDNRDRAALLPWADAVSARLRSLG